MNPAEPDDPTGRRRAAVRAARCVLRVVAVVGTFAAVVAMPAVAAGEGRFGGHGGRGPGMHAAQINGRMMRQERMQGGALRERPGREAPQPPGPALIERPPETAPVDRGGRPGRLTPEERRALRQQINDAGREIYRGPRP